MNFDEIHVRNSLKYSKELDKLYDEFIQKHINTFRKANPKERAINQMLYRANVSFQYKKNFTEYQNKVLKLINKGIEKEWNLAYDKYQYDVANDKELSEFLNRKIKGKTTKDRAKNIVSESKGDFEKAVSDFLKKGGSINDLESIKKELKNSSSKKQARRLVLNETNIAYKENERLLFTENPDVTGIDICLSPYHKVYDICDELAGRYPKDFHYTHWHIGCMCRVRPVFKTEIKDVPENFKKWVSENAEKIQGWKNKPDWITENEKYTNLSQELDLISLMNKAKDSQLEVEDMLQVLNNKYGGYSTPINFKSRESTLRKVNSELDGDVWAVKDAVRATVVIPIKNHKNIVDNLEKSGIFERVKFQTPEKFSGYRGIITNFKTSTGISAEIQFNTDKMIYAKEKPKNAIRIIGLKRWNEIKIETGLQGGLGHEFYEKMRVLDKQDPKRLEFEKQSIEYYKHFIR